MTKPISYAKLPSVGTMWANVWNEYATRMSCEVREIVVARDGRQWIAFEYRIGEAETTNMGLIQADQFLSQWKPL